MQKELIERLAARWSARSPFTIANAASAPFFGTAGEWDLPRGVEPRRELLYLAVGIPDAHSLPKAALMAAANKVPSPTRRCRAALRVWSGTNGAPRLARGTPHGNRELRGHGRLVPDDQWFLPRHRPLRALTCESEKRDHRGEPDLHGHTAQLSRRNRRTSVSRRWTTRGSIRMRSGVC